MRLFLNEHDILSECCLFTLTRWQPLIAKDQEQINGSCLGIRFFSVCEKKNPNSTIYKMSGFAVSLPFEWFKPHAMIFFWIFF
jgi:hypothetical protein